MTNSETMTAAERLAQKLKSSGMGELLSDDDLAKIAGDAIKMAFFEKRQVPSSSYGYGNSTTKEPEIVEMARDVFRDAVKEHIDPIVRDLAQDEEFRKLIQKTAIACIPDMLLGYGRTITMEAAQKGSQEAYAQAVFLVDQKFQAAAQR